MSIGIDLAGRTFFVPTETRPPRENHYEYQLATDFREPHQLEKDNMERRIGCSIRPINDTEMTDVQVERALSITLLVLTVIASLALLAAGLILGMMPLIIAGAASFVVLGGISAGYTVYAYCKDDLEDADNRQLLIQQCQTRTFQQLTQQFTKDQVIAFDLLEPRVNHLTPDQKQIFYWRLSELYDRSDLLSQAKRRMLSHVQQVYRNGIQPFLVWQNHYKNHLTNILSQRQNPRYPVPLDNLKTPRERQNEQLLDQHYNRLVAPWRAWEREVTASIEAVTNACFTTLYEMYQNLAPPQNPPGLIQPPNATLPQNPLGEAIERVRQSPIVTTGSPPILDWENIQASMTERYIQLPRLLLLDLLQHATASQCRGYFHFGEYTDTHIHSCSNDIARVRNLTSIQGLASLKTALSALSQQAIADLATYLAGDGIPANAAPQIRTIYLDICDACYPLQTFAPFITDLSNMLD